MFRLTVLSVLFMVFSAFSYSAQVLRFTTDGTSGTPSVEPGFSFNSVWMGMGTGKNGHIYLAVCGQQQSNPEYNVSGNPEKANVCVIEYNPYTNTMKSCGTVKDASLAAGNWMANESADKIHTHLSSMPDGKIWMATHDNDGNDEDTASSLWYPGIFYRGSHIYYIDIYNGDTLVDYSATQKYYYKRDSPVPSLRVFGGPISDTAGVAYQYESILVMNLNPYQPRYLWTMSNVNYWISVWDLIDDTTRTLGTGMSNMREMVVNKQGDVYYIPSTQAMKKSPDGGSRIVGNGLNRGHSMTYSRSFDSAFTISGQSGYVNLFDFVNDTVRQIADLPNGNARAYRTVVVSKDGAKLYCIGSGDNVYEINIATGAYSSVYNIGSYISSYSYATGNMGVDSLGNIYSGLHRYNEANAARLLKINLGTDLVAPLDIPDDPSPAEERTVWLKNGEIVSAVPNPFKSRVVITIGKEFRVSSFELQIFDITGKQLATRNSQLATSFTWNASRMPAGVYVLRLRAGNRNYCKKIVLQK